MRLVLIDIRLESQELSPDSESVNESDQQQRLPVTMTAERFCGSQDAEEAEDEKDDVLSLSQQSTGDELKVVREAVKKGCECTPHCFTLRHRYDSCQHRAEARAGEG